MNQNTLKQFIYENKTTKVSQLFYLFAYLFTYLKKWLFLTHHVRDVNVETGFARNSA